VRGLEVGLIIFCRAACPGPLTTARTGASDSSIETRELNRLAIPTDTAQNRGVGIVLFFFRINLVREN